MVGKKTLKGGGEKNTSKFGETQHKSGNRRNQNIRGGGDRTMFVTLQRGGELRKKNKKHRIVGTPEMGGGKIHLVKLRHHSQSSTKINRQRSIHPTLPTMTKKALTSENRRMEL